MAQEHWATNLLRKWIAKYLMKLEKDKFRAASDNSDDAAENRRSLRSLDSRCVRDNAQRPAAASKSEGRQESARAIFTRFRSVTFLSPRSIFPMWLRSMSAMFASASCEMSSSSRRVRIDLPTAPRCASVSVRPDTLSIEVWSRYHARLATAFTTHCDVTDELGRELGI